MTRRKRPLEPVTGVTTQRDKIVKVWYGNIVIDVNRRTRCQYSAFTRRFKAIESVDEADIKRAVRAAKTWLKLLH